MPGDSSEKGGGWIHKASEDELSIRAILQSGAASTACFLSQQLAEKSLKGLLVFHGVPFPKVHDLLQLETLLLDKEPQIKQLHSNLEILNRYYIETRYPGNYPEFSDDEARQAFEAALQVKDFVVERVS